MRKQLQRFSLCLSLFLTGLYGGTGFFVLMGGNPATAGLSEHGFAEYWQLVDSYMGARMPVFGSLLLFTLVFTVLTLIPKRRYASFWLVLAALLIIVADLIFTLSTNHPLNQLIQTWDLNNLPSNTREVQAQVVKAFWSRSAFMISSFACLVLAVIFQKDKA